MTPTVLHDPVQAAAWLRSRVSGHLQADSRHVQAGDGFIAWPGAATDGRRYLAAALAQGAAACLVEQEGAHAFDVQRPEVALYPQLKAATARIASAYYADPSQQLHTVAVTGTNGKTSTTWWLAWALARLGRADLSPCAVVGTLGVGLPQALAYTGLTTPDPVLLQRRLRALLDEGARACAIEASSIGLAEHRLDGLAIRVAMFTNFTQDHLDYHGDMQAYWLAKRALFDWPGLQAAVVHVGDACGQALAQHVRARGVPVWTHARERAASVQATDVVQGPDGLSWVVREGAQFLPVNSRLIGGYNVDNLMGVITALRALGVPLADAVAVCHELPAVPGRMECLSQPGAPLAVVDYAHTPDAVAQALQALRPLVQARGGQLWCVLGCGGNRDALKRPRMAAAAETHADQVVLTSDNPRDEDPLHILKAMQAGLRHPAAARVEVERAAGIAHALQQAAPQDVVLIAGKGHEDYQEIAGQRLPFSDQAQARLVLQARAQQERGLA